MRVSLWVTGRCCCGLNVGLKAPPQLRDQIYAFQDSFRAYDKTLPLAVGRVPTAGHIIGINQALTVGQQVALLKGPGQRLQLCGREMLVVPMVIDRRPGPFPLIKALKDIPAHGREPGPALVQGFDVALERCDGRL